MTAGSRIARMYALIGRVKIKPGQAELTRSMIADGGVAMVQGMAGSSAAYWASAVDGGELIQHSFWLFDTEENARKAETTFNSLRDMPDAPAIFVSCDVCEVIGHVYPPRERSGGAPARIGENVTGCRGR